MRRCSDPETTQDWPTRDRTHKIQVRPDRTVTGWLWICLTCGQVSGQLPYLSRQEGIDAGLGHEDVVNLLP